MPSILTGESSKIVRLTGHSEPGARLVKPVITLRPDRDTVLTGLGRIEQPDTKVRVVYPIKVRT